MLYTGCFLCMPSIVMLPMVVVIIAVQYVVHWLFSMYSIIMLSNIHLSTYCGLFADFSPPVYTGSRMSFYELLRERVLKKNPDGTFPVW